jgi:hypothetical protein
MVAHKTERHLKGQMPIHAALVPRVSTRPSPAWPRGYSRRALVRQDRLKEAERYVLAAVETVGPQDASSIPATKTALGMVLAAQGRDHEAEALLRENSRLGGRPRPGLDLRRERQRVASLLRFQGRTEEAAELEARIETRTRVG